MARSSRRHQSPTNSLLRSARPKPKPSPWNGVDFRSSILSDSTAWVGNRSFHYYSVLWLVLLPSSFTHINNNGFLFVFRKGLYEDFSKVTLRSLHHALSVFDAAMSDSEAEDMLRAYDSLATFPDVAPLMQRLKAASGIRAFVFSNGTREMVSGSIHKSPDLRPHASVFDGVVVVGPCRKFKPAPEVYHHLAKSVGKDANDRAQMAEIWLVSSNPFDVVGARSVGMNVVWVDRDGKGWQDRVLERDVGEPTVIVDSLDKVVQAVMPA